MLAPADVALRDAILAVLRDTPETVTAQTLVPLLPRRTRLMTGTPTGFCADDHAILRRHPAAQEVHLIECRGTRGHLVSERPPLGVVIHHLADLYLKGYVQRAAGEDGAPATWMWIEPQLVPGRRVEADTARECAAILAAAGITGSGAL